MRTRNAQYTPHEKKEQEPDREKSGAKPSKGKSGKALSGPQEIKRGRGRPPKRAAETAREDPEHKVTKKKAPQNSKDVKETRQAGKTLPENPCADQSAAQQHAPASPTGRPQLAPSGTLAGPSSPQRPAPASPSAQQPAQSPQRTAGKKGAPQQRTPAAARAQNVPIWEAAQDAARKEVEDAAVRRALDSGRFVDVAVHSFIPEIPPSRLALPEDATINFLRRQIQYRIEGTGAHLPADALEVQVKDSWGTLTTTASFSAAGAEITVRSYGLVPGPQHHIWVLVVDDTDVRDQRAATSAVAQLPGSSGAGVAGAATAAALPERRLAQPEQQAYTAYQSALSPARPAPEGDAAAAAAGSPGRRRQKNKRFSDEERNALIEGVFIMGTGHWAAILDRFSTVFAPGRNSVDLKDKWRNLVKAAKSSNREQRGGAVPREQVIKIMEVVHREDHPGSEEES
ncbi:g6383 [Coccomyxa elongata]